jgi:plasmid stability protein
MPARSQPVSQLTIRRLDPDVIERLRRRAAAAGRSMEEEARTILTNAVVPDRRELIERLRALRESVGFVGDSADLVRDAREERDAQLDEAMGWKKE